MPRKICTLLGRKKKCAMHGNFANFQQSFEYSCQIDGKNAMTEQKVLIRAIIFNRYEIIFLYFQCFG